MNEQDESRGMTIGMAIFALSIVICSMEMVPGWGFLHLELPRVAFYTTAGVCGAIAGFLIGHYRVAGSLAGVLAEVGALFAIALVLEHVNWVPNFVLVLVGGIGTLPGVCLYYVLTFPFQRRTVPAETTDPTRRDANHLPPDRSPPAR